MMLFLKGNLSSGLWSVLVLTMFRDYDAAWGEKMGAPEMLLQGWDPPPAKVTRLWLPGPLFGIYQWLSLSERS